LAGKQPALPDNRLPADKLFEAFKIGFSLTGKVDHGEDCNLEAKTFLVQQRTIAFDKTGLLQRAHASQTRRSGNANALRQLHVGDPTVVLKFFEDPAIDGVESAQH